jgi:hypothetical protein
MITTRATYSYGLFLLTEIRAYWPRHVAHIHPQTARNIIEECAAKQFSKALAIRFDWTPEGNGHIRFAPE